MIQMIRAAMAVIAILVLAACDNGTLTPQGERALIGASIGAVAGAASGGGSERIAQGAIIGAAIGASDYGRQMQQRGRTASACNRFATAGERRRCQEGYAASLRAEQRANERAAYEYGRGL